MFRSVKPNHQTKRPSVDQRIDALVDRLLVYLMYFILFGLVMFMVRLLQVGPSVGIFLQIGISAVLVLVIALRKFLPRPVVLGVSMTALMCILTLAISRFGLLSPGITLTVLIPIVIGNLSSMRNGFVAMCVMGAMLSGVGYLFTTGTLQIVGGFEGYFEEPINWILHITLYTAIVASGVAITSRASEYWREAVEDLSQENILRQASEERRLQTEKWWGTIGDNFPGVMFDIKQDENGNETVLRISKGTQELWGLSRQEILDDIGALDARLSDASLSLLRQTLRTAAQDMSSWDLRLPMTAKDGTEKWVHASGKPVRQSDGSILWHIIAIDVSTQVAAEQESQQQRDMLAQLQRQESIGQLSGGVAHDFNNLLAVIMGNLEFIRDETTQTEVLSYIDQALEATTKGADLTRNMLAFAKKAVLDPVPLNLNEIALEASGWISRTIPENITMETQLEPRLHVTRADESSVVSAMLNLIVNARDAMHLGGHLLIETENQNLDETQAKKIDIDLKAGTYVVLSITDTGSGIAEIDHARIFDPFVTTKGPTEGTGLGLAMVQGFMRQSGGAVQVVSDLGKGATFSLYFQAEKERVKAVTPPQTIPHAAKTSKSARILIVEDEPDLLDYLQAVLSRFGYSVQTAINGDDAWNLFKQDNRFDLVLTDQIMPGTLQGIGLAQKIQAINPKLPVLIMSGYTGVIPPHGASDATIKVDLFKPIKRTDLISAIEQALAQNSD